ncbi:MAG: DUF1549 domain-containing protein, partial [Phycisphaerae bacterium]|nr:DUF1549 domain-containing protein [Phycisphaerae bacterium]
MSRSHTGRALPMAWLFVTVAVGMAYAAVGIKPFPGLADPGRPVGIQLEAPHTPAGTPLRLVGPDQRLQLVVSARHDSGQSRDWTRRVTYAATPAGVVEISRRGRVTPVGDGQATITATDSQSQLATSVKVSVERFANPPPLNFANQVVPIFTKLGCNSGACHGKSGGQNGFRLSLLGFEPARDYEYLVKESRGRRLFPAAPDSSLLLLKASNAIPHGGGERLTTSGHDYRVLRRWVAQGMPVGRKEDPTLKSIAVYPPQRIMPREGEQQLRVIATYTDGTRQDVTGTAQYEPNNEDMAEIDEAGGVRMLGRPGDVAVMVRYQGQVSTFVATVPLGLEVGQLPAPRNFIDEKVAAKWKQLGLPPSPRCSDAEFIRRLTLDITGRLPDPETARAFLSDTRPDKRDRAIDR